MYINEIALWNRNRHIYFKAGLVTALFSCYVVINMEFLNTNAGITEPEYLPEVSSLTLLAHSEAIRVPDPPAVKAAATPSSAYVPPQIFTPVAVDLPVTTQPDFPTESPTLPPVVYAAPPAPEPAQKENNEPMVFAEEMPFLTSCSHLTGRERNVCTEKTMLELIYKHLKYPPIAKELNVQGTVIISFVIDKNGQLGEVNILRDIGGGCGKAAAVVIKNLGQWSPGYQNKKAVNVKYSVPIKFVLQ